MGNLIHSWEKNSDPSTCLSVLKTQVKFWKQFVIKILNFLHEFWPVVNSFYCLLQYRQPEQSSASTP